MLMHELIFFHPIFQSETAFHFPTSWTWLLSHGCGISMGADLLSSSTKLLQCDGGHVFEGLSRKMNLLFDTPLPQSYCEIRLAPVSFLPVRGACVCVCACVCPGRVLPDISAFEVQLIISSERPLTPMATLQSCRSMLISCLLRLYTNTNGETEGQNTWNESGKSKHSNCNQAETKTNRKKVTEWEKASRGMKRGWGVLMETRVSVASCVCGSVTEGRPLALRSHQCQWTKSPLNWLIWFACRAAACPLPSSMTYSTVCTSGFSSHSPFPFFSFLCLSLPLFFLDRTFFFFFWNMLQSWNYYQGGTASVFDSGCSLSSKSTWSNTVF